MLGTLAITHEVSGLSQVASATPSATLSKALASTSIPAINNDLEARRFPIGMKLWCLLVQDNTQEGFVDLKSAIVMNEAQFPEFVHEQIHPGARCANHFRQHFL
jgi:hypothetical protein